MKFSGKISISRYSGSSSGISIELSDTDSGVRVVRIDLTPEQFGNAVSGLGYVDCSFELGGVEYVGKKREHKTVLMSVSKYPSELKNSEIEKLFSEYEVDGWNGRRSDFLNHHNYNMKNKTVSVVFERYI